MWLITHASLLTDGLSLVRRRVSESSGHSERPSTDRRSVKTAIRLTGGFCLCCVAYLPLRFDLQGLSHKPRFSRSMDQLL